MDTLWTEKGVFRRVSYHNEASLEAAILQVQTDLFGANRIYLDVKKKIGAKGGKQNIPDGYLIDLTGQTPRLYVVENELASHEPLRHIAVQILEFSLAFESAPRGVRTVLFNSLTADASAKTMCEEYLAAHGFRNLDHFLDDLVHKTPFAALVIIDELPESLESVLINRFKFGVEVIELARYEGSHGECVYRFEPFLADVTADIAAARLSADSVTPALPVEALDTIVVPAREDGLQETFLGENRWYKIRISGTMIPQIKYIATYEVAPTSAITYIGLVDSIEPWKDSGYYCVNLKEHAEAISPIKLVAGGRVKAPQSMRYTNYERLQQAKTLDDVW